MAIVSMKKMSLVAHKSDRSRLMKIFVRSGCVEINETPLEEMTAYPTDTAKRDAIDSKRLKVSFAITFLREMLKEIARVDKDGKYKANFKKENRLVPLDEYDTVARDEVEIFSRIAGMEKINARLVDLKSEKARLIASVEQLTPYKGCDLIFSQITDTATCKFLLGTVSENKLETLRSELPATAELAEYGGDKAKCVAVIYHAETEKEVQSSLAAADFVRCSFEYDTTAQGKIDELNEKIKDADIQRDEAIKSAMEYLKDLSNLKILYDYYTLEITKFDAVAHCPHTQKAFVMEGWVPAEKAEQVEQAVKSECKYTEIAFRDPFEGENPPTLVRNNKIVSQFEGITDMFGAPGYKEPDPNIFVAIFYFLIFGIMIGDAGYGLLMAIACFAYLKIVKPVKNSGKMIAMFGFCGISTFIWGALFGGWFAIEGLSTTFLGKLVIFEPLTNPLAMFLLALAVGVIQIGTGFVINGVMLIKNKKYAEGILGNIGWGIIMLGLLLVFPAIIDFLNVLDGPSPAWFGVCSKIGMYVAIAGFAMMLVGGAVGKKNPLKMLIGVFKSAYGSINVVSDLLSYSRLFGLGLTTGVIGMVVNRLATIIVNQFFGGLWVGWFLGVPILIIGHSFNLGINLLGAYVHNSRLQYIEFFGRFYEGSGRAFNPIGGSAKYTYPDN